MEANLTAARHEVDEEIRLASEQKAQHGRELQQLECGKNERHRTANWLFQSLQLVGMAEQKELQVQKAVKEEGTYIINVSLSKTGLTKSGRRAV